MQIKLTRRSGDDLTGGWIVPYENRSYWQGVDVDRIVFCDSEFDGLFRCWGSQEVMLVVSHKEMHPRSQRFYWDMGFPELTLDGAGQHDTYAVFPSVVRIIDRLTCRASGWLWAHVITLDHEEMSDEDYYYHSD